MYILLGLIYTSRRSGIERNPRSFPEVSTQGKCTELAGAPEIEPGILHDAIFHIFFLSDRVSFSRLPLTMASHYLNKPPRKI